MGFWLGQWMGDGVGYRGVLGEGGKVEQGHLSYGDMLGRRAADCSFTLTLHPQPWAHGGGVCVSWVRAFPEKRRVSKGLLAVCVLARKEGGRRW